ncbi:UpxY family transcription antiterminator [Emticicia agri]|uniref:UpxY family transcription antiterminator n=1 Tax=Emticicia agri TaxID=2492393 RepID=A0A4Q5LTF1_9BACT|nr:UpxY family transcription antiterminator [Emticicia agri]RYU92906.1 UpxY family transcription antiterminator [Emticicia agri]
MKKWFVIYTKPRQEKKVANELAKISIESYCPTKKVERQWSDRKKKVETPLFTSYCFVHIEEKDRNKVFQVPGVVRYVFWLKKPAIVRDEEIEEIKRWLNDYNHEYIETRKFQDNERLIIKSGLLIDQQATVVKQNGNQLILQLENLGFTLCVSQTDMLLSPV